MSAAASDTSLPLLCCSAGGVPLGLCAEEVAGFSALEGGAPHMAVLLRLGQASEVDLDGQSERRTLRLHAGGRQALVNVDGPVHMESAGAGQLRPLPRFLEASATGTVIGFWADGRGGPLRVLVDVAAVLGLALGDRRGGERRC